MYRDPDRGIRALFVAACMAGVSLLAVLTLLLVPDFLLMMLLIGGIAATGGMLFFKLFE